MKISNYSHEEFSPIVRSELEWVVTRINIDINGIFSIIYDSLTRPNDEKLLHNRHIFENSSGIKCFVQKDTYEHIPERMVWRFIFKDSSCTSDIFSIKLDNWGNQIIQFSSIISENTHSRKLVERPLVSEKERRQLILWVVEIMGILLGKDDTLYRKIFTQTPDYIKNGNFYG